MEADGAFTIESFDIENKCLPYWKDEWGTHTREPPLISIGLLVKMLKTMLTGGEKLPSHLYVLGFSYTCQMYHTRIY